MSLAYRRVPPLAELVLTYGGRSPPPSPSASEEEEDDEAPVVADVTAHAFTPWTKDTQRFGARPADEPLGPAGDEAVAADARLLGLFGAGMSYYNSAARKRLVTLLQAFRDSRERERQHAASEQRVLAATSPGTLAHPGTITDAELYDANFFPGLSYTLKVQAANSENNGLSETAATTERDDIPTRISGTGTCRGACALLQPASGDAAVKLVLVDGTQDALRGSTARFTHMRSIATFHTSASPMVPAAQVLDRSKLVAAGAGMALSPSRTCFSTRPAGGMRPKQVRASTTPRAATTSRPGRAKHGHGLDLRHLPAGPRRRQRPRRPLRRRGARHVRTVRAAKRRRRRQRRRREQHPRGYAARARRPASATARAPRTS